MQKSCARIGSSSVRISGRAAVSILGAVRAAPVVAARSVSIAAVPVAASAAPRATRASSARVSAALAFTPVRAFASPASAQVSGAVGDVIAFPLADIGEGIAECEVIQWFVKEGDVIAQFDKLCEVQSDKANVEITSRYDGVVERLAYKQGEMAQVGAPLVHIKLSTAVGGAAAAAAAAPAASGAAAGCPIAAAKAAAAATGGAVLSTARPGRDVLASPVVRRLAGELGIDLARVNPTGSKGQVTKDDVYAFQAQVAAGGVPAPVVAAAPAAAAAAPVAAAPAAKAEVSVPRRSATAGAAADVELPVTGIQKVMVKTMTAAAAVPTLGFADEICVDKLIALRKQVAAVAKDKHGVKLSYFAFIIKALSLALTKFPLMNAHVNADCSVVTQRGSHNIGLAMDTPKGLLVPNVKNVQDLSLLEIGAELNRLQTLGAAGKLGPQDLKGGTITLSNIGTVGGTYCTPVLVVPEVAIAALGKFHTVAAFDSKGQVYPSTVLNIGWTADHRVLDGAYVARFSNEVKHYIENPESMMLY